MASADAAMYGEMLETEPSIPPPHALLALTEAHRAAAEILTLAVTRKIVDKAPRGDGHPVMVLPGFLGADGYNAAFRRYLTGLDYAVHGWGQGRNLGPREGVLEAAAVLLCWMGD